MGKSSKGVVVAIAVGVVTAAGLALIYWKVMVPRRQAEAARAEVDRWGQRWAAARRCLVGTAPRSSSGVEAALLRELTADGDVVAELRACRALVPALRRDAGEPIHGADLERGWTAIEESVAALARAHAWRVAPRATGDAARLRHRLGQAIAGMDDAYARLRGQAGLAADPPAGRPLALLSPIPAPAAPPIPTPAPAAQEPVLAAQAVDRAELGEPVAASVAAPPSVQLCAAGELVWWRLPDASLSLQGPGDAAPRPIAGGTGLSDPLTCAGARVLARAGERGDRLALCSAAGCVHTATVPALTMGRAAVALGAVAGPMLAVEVEGVVVLWSGDPERGQSFAASAAARLPPGHVLHGLVEQSGEPVLVARSAGGLRGFSLAAGSSLAGRTGG